MADRGPRAGRALRPVNTEGPQELSVRQLAEEVGVVPSSPARSDIAGSVQRLLDGAPPVHGQGAGLTAGRG